MQPSNYRTQGETMPDRKLKFRYHLQTREYIKDEVRPMHIIWVAYTLVGGIAAALLCISLGYYFIFESNSWFSEKNLRGFAVLFTMVAFWLVTSFTLKKERV